MNAAFCRFRLLKNDQNGSAVVRMEIISHFSQLIQFCNHGDCKEPRDHRVTVCFALLQKGEGIGVITLPVSEIFITF